MRSPLGSGKPTTGRPLMWLDTVPSARAATERRSRSLRHCSSVHTAVTRPAMKSRRPAATAAIGRPLDADTGLAGHAGAAETAVAVGILREILLVVVLGVVELRRRQNLGRDRPVAGLRERPLVLVARSLRGGALRLVVEIDPGAILRADVVALAHALRRIVALPERLQQVVVRHLRRIEHD